METLKQKQLRCIKAGFYNGRIGGDTDHNWGNNWWYGNPFNRPISELKIAHKITYPLWCTDILKTKGKVFKEIQAEFHKKHLTYPTNVRIITIDDIVVYINTDADNGRISAAWSTLTEVFFDGYRREPSGVPHYVTNVESFEYWHRWDLANPNEVNRPEVVIKKINLQNYIQHKVSKLGHWY